MGLCSIGTILDRLDFLWSGLPCRSQAAEPKAARRSIDVVYWFHCSTFRNERNFCQSEEGRLSLSAGWQESVLRNEAAVWR